MWVKFSLFQMKHLCSLIALTGTSEDRIMLDINGQSVYFQVECCNLRRLAAARTWAGLQSLNTQAGRQIGPRGLGVHWCVGACWWHVPQRAGSGHGHQSRLKWGESVASGHMVESVALGQGQAKTFPHWELVRVKQTCTVSPACSANNLW